MPPIPAEQATPDGGAIPSPLAHSIAQVCERTSIGRTLVYEAIGRGELKAKKIGRRTLILDSDLRAWIASLPAINRAA